MVRALPKSREEKKSFTLLVRGKDLIRPVGRGRRGLIETLELDFGMCSRKRKRLSLS